MKKALKEMNNRELFGVLTGDGEIVQQTMLKKLIWAYKAKHPEMVGKLGEVNLAAIVADMTDD